VTAPRVLVAVNLEPHPADFLEQAKKINTEMQPPNPWFSSPPVPYTTVTAHIANYEAAIIAAANKAPGTVDARDAAGDVLALDLRHQAGYVQLVADQNPSSSEQIIKSSGFDVKGAAVRPPRVFAVTQEDISGEALIVVPSGGPGTTYFWQAGPAATVQTNVAAWVSYPPTHKAKTTISGLAPGVLTSFRYRTLIGDVESDWSQVITIIIK
jgi:hypothetical protein